MHQRIAGMRAAFGGGRCCILLCRERGCAKTEDVKRVHIPIVRPKASTPSGSCFEQVSGQNRHAAGQTLIMFVFWRELPQTLAAPRRSAVAKSSPIAGSITIADNTHGITMSCALGSVLVRQALIFGLANGIDGAGIIGASDAGLRRLSN